MEGQFLHAPPMERTQPALWRPLDLYLDRLAPSSRRAMVERLRRAATLYGLPYDAVAWHTLTGADLAAIRDALQAEGASPSTINVTLAAVRGVARAARELGLIEWREIDDLGAVRQVSSAMQPLGRPLAQGEVAALFAVCLRDRTTAGGRDAALLIAMYAAGLYCTEAVALDCVDVRLTPATLRVKAGPGRRERVVDLAAAAADALAGWLAIRGRGPGRLFVRIGQGGRIVGECLAARSLNAIMHKRVEQADLAPIMPQDLRRTAIRDLFDAGASVLSVQRIVGQVQLETIARYDHRDPNHLPRGARHDETLYHKW